MTRLHRGRAAAIGLAALLALGAAGCGSTGPGASGSAVASSGATASAAPSVTPVPTGTPAPLPAGWTRYDVSDAFSIGIPDTWILLTTKERDDAAAAQTVKRLHPAETDMIVAAVVQMKSAKLLMWALAPSGSSGTGIWISEPATGTLDLAFARTQSARLMTSTLALEQAPEPRPLDSLPAFRIAWAKTIDGSTYSGLIYLVQEGPKIWTLSLTTGEADPSAWEPTLATMARSLRSR